MIRVLHVVPRLFAGGEQTLIMNWYRNIDREKVQFDFVVCHSEKGVFEDEVRELGGVIYHSPRYNGKNHFIYVKWWKDFFSEHKEISIVHGHLRSTASIYLKIAKDYDLFTIAHSHSVSNGKGISAIIKDVLQYPLRNIADYMMGCSDSAGQYLFGKKVLSKKNYKTLPNAVDCNAFSYSETVRNKIRGELRVQNSFIIGQVGRFHSVKNHIFTIEVFKKISELLPDSILLLVGDGELRSLIENKCSDYGLLDRVIFTGVKTNIADYYQAMDLLLFPSLFEGLGIVAIEAQTSGLRCICSDRIPKDVAVSDCCIRLPLDRQDLWIEAVCSKAEVDRAKYSEIVRKAGYDIKIVTEWLESFYESYGIDR